MFKKTLAKASVATLLLGGLAYAASPDSLVSVACYPPQTGPGVTLNVPSMSANDQTAVAGSASAAGTAAGTLKVYRYESVNGTGSGTQVNVTDQTVTASDRQVDFTVNNATHGGHTDSFVAFFQPTDTCTSTASQSEVKKMTVQYRPGFAYTDSGNGSNRVWKLVVSGNASGGQPTGTVTFYKKSGGDSGPRSLTGINSTNNAQATYGPGDNSTLCDHWVFTSTNNAYATTTSTSC
jgi:hypothetical protein